MISEMMVVMLSVGFGRIPETIHQEVILKWLADLVKLSLTAYWIDKILGNMRTAILFPSLYLLSQFYTDWLIKAMQRRSKE